MKLIAEMNVGDGTYFRLWQADDTEGASLSLELDTGLSSMFLTQDEADSLSVFLNSITFSVEVGDE